MSAHAQAHDDGRGASFHRVLDAMQALPGAGRVQPAGSWVKVICPAHEDQTPSLGLKYDPVQQRTVVACFGNCDQQTVLAAAGLKVRDLFDHPRGRNSGTITTPQRAPLRLVPPLTTERKPDLGPVTGSAYTAAEYSYHDADGLEIGLVRRRHIPHANGVEKRFSQRRLVGGGTWTNGGFAPVLYRLPMIRSAIRDGYYDIYLVEGEKDADRINKLGQDAGLPIVATCNAMGAGKFRPEHAHQLRGARRVVIVADKDAPGYRHATQIHQLLRGRVQNITIVAAATGKDASDHLDAGHELTDLAPVDAETLAQHSQLPTTTTPQPARAGQEKPVTDEQAHGGDMDQIGRQWAALIAIMVKNIADWGKNKAARREEALKKAAQVNEELAERLQRQFEAERKMVETRLANVGGDDWFKDATREDVLDAWRDAVTWADESEEAKEAQERLAGGLLKHYGVDVSKLPAAEVDNLKPAVHEAYWAGAALERAEAAQRHAVNAAAATDLSDGEKMELYAAISSYTHNAARSLAVQRSATATPGPEKAEMAAARAQMEYMLRSVPDAQRDKVLFSLDYLTRSPSADPGAADFGAESVVKVRIEELFAQYRTGHMRGHDTSAEAGELKLLIKELATKEDRAAANAHGRKIHGAPATDPGRVWPSLVDKDRLYAQIMLYHQAQAAELPKDELAKIRETITSPLAQKGHGLAPIEVDQIRLTVKDLDQPSSTGAPLPGVLFADRAWHDRQQQRSLRDVAHERTLDATTNMLWVLQREPGVSPQALEKMDETLTQLGKHTVDVATGLVNKAGPLMKKEQTAIKEQMQAAGIRPSSQTLVTTALAKLETSAFRAATQVSQQAWPAYDSPARRTVQQQLWLDEGVDQEAAEAMGLADIGEATSPTTATKPKSSFRPAAKSGPRSTSFGQTKGRGR